MLIICQNSFSFEYFEVTKFSQCHLKKTVEKFKFMKKNAKFLKKCLIFAKNLSGSSFLRSQNSRSVTFKKTVEKFKFLKKMLNF